MPKFSQIRLDAGVGQRMIVGYAVVGVGRELHGAPLVSDSTREAGQVHVAKASAFVLAEGENKVRCRSALLLLQRFVNLFHGIACAARSLPPAFQ